MESGDFTPSSRGCLFSPVALASAVMHANKLHINMKKCCYMHFRPKISTSDGGQDNNNQHTKIIINDYEIDEVEETKFLGVTIDNKLTWLPHLLAKKLKCCSGQLNRIKMSCRAHTLIQKLVPHLI